MTTASGTSGEGIAGWRDSRAATDALLAVLRHGRWGPRAGTRFLLLAAERSLRQAAWRPRAIAEITALHAAFVAVSRGHRHGWVAIGWTLAATHLGLLEGRDRLSAADVLTLCRANLPALAERRGVRWAGSAAIVTDLADGRLARRNGTVCPFGIYADHFADAAFWTWLVWRHEHDARWRTAALVAWAAPVVAVTAISVAGGRMVDAPRPALMRPAAAMQAAVALRRLLERPGAKAR